MDLEPVTFCRHATYQHKAEMSKHKHLTNAEREQVLMFLLERVENDELKRGALSETAEHFSVHVSTVSRWWSDWVKKTEGKRSSIMGRDV